MFSVKVVLFKENGKYYTEEEWEVPEDHEFWMYPSCMKDSPDFRRIGNGPVLIIDEKWGYPHIL